LNKDLQQLNAKLDAGEIGEIGYREDEKILKEEAQKRLADVRKAFGAAFGPDLRERVGPKHSASRSHVLRFLPPWVERV
jgi:STIP1 family protein 1